MLCDWTLVASCHEQDNTLGSHDKAEIKYILGKNIKILEHTYAAIEFIHQFWVISVVPIDLQVANVHLATISCVLNAQVLSLRDPLHPLDGYDALAIVLAIALMRQNGDFALRHVQQLVQVHAHARYCCFHTKRVNVK